MLYCYFRKAYSRDENAIFVERVTKEIYSYCIFIRNYWNYLYGYTDIGYTVSPYSIIKFYISTIPYLCTTPQTKLKF